MAPSPRPPEGWIVVRELACWFGSGGQITERNGFSLGLRRGLSERP